MNALLAAWKIAWGTASYRVEKREAGNLVTSGTLAVALGLAPGDVVVRVAFGAVLNVLVYLVNDCFDVGVDLAAPSRNNARTRFLAENIGTGWVVVLALSLVLAAIGALHGGGLLLALGVNLVVIFAYSRALKRRPLLDFAAMAAWGVSMAMVGFPPSSRAGWMLAGLLGLFCVVTEGVQVIRDEPSDRRAGVRTSAVALGVPATALLTRGFVVLSAAYTTLFLQALVGPVILAAALLPLRSERIERTWDALRILFGVTWLAVLFAFHRSGHLSGAIRLW